MKVLVVGASGATGKHVVEQLLDKKHQVKAVLRSTEKMPEWWKANEYLEIIPASILDLSDDEMNALCSDCEAIVSCLGHNLTFKGMYGQPRRLVTDATRRLCNAVQFNAPKQAVKFVLMNTTGNSNRDLNETISFAQKCVIALLRLLLPPHVDNEKAADYLRTSIGQKNKFIEWVVVRPDGLTNENDITAYELHQSPIRSAIFDAGKTSRINVANFMASLVSNATLWNTWKGQMPVIFNKTN